MDTLLNIAQIIDAFAVVILAIITGVYAYHTYKIAKSPTVPHIEAALACSWGPDPTFVLRISNVGPGLAKNSHIKFWTEPAVGSEREWKPLVLFPGDYRDFGIPVGPTKDDVEMDRNRLADNYKYLQFQATYKDVSSHSYKTSLTIDLKSYIAHIQQVGMLEPIHELEIHYIRTELEKIRTLFEALLTKG